MGFNTYDTYVKITFMEELLGTQPGDEGIYDTFVANNSPNPGMTTDEELENLQVADSEHPDKALTIFAKDADGTPCLYDYHIKGFFKDACSMIQRITNGKDENGKKKKVVTESSKMTAYKKTVDGIIFTYPRLIPIIMLEGGEVGRCQRPLRASTPQGERVALSNAETIPAGSYIVVKIQCFSADNVPAVIEWLDYGCFRGLGQWRNSGKGRFSYEIIDKKAYDEFYKKYEKDRNARLEKIAEAENV